MSSYSPAIRAFAIASVAVASVVPASAQTTPIFRMDCSGSRYPNCGFTISLTSREGTSFTRTLVPGGSPTGRDSVRFNFRAQGSAGQFDAGWQYYPSQDVPDGAVRYIRYRIKVVSPADWRSAGGGNSGGVAFKNVILGNNCEDGSIANPGAFAPTRVIQTFGMVSGSDPRFLQWQLTQSTEGPPIEMRVVGLVVGRWHNVQLRMQPSSPDTANNANLRLYLDAANSNEAQPSGQSSGSWRLRTRGWSSADGCDDSNISFGAVAAWNAATTGVAFELADFEYDDQFDPNWNTGGSTPLPLPPSAPSNLRIVTSATGALLPLLFLLRRRRQLR